ncbi:54S ribosomal protein L6 mitochondrial [Neophaeococcomyces mojaviensis]|uniref:54S ribosomal protein L6 mitochondrial n=1 Tax=Neophaeococcomyces mojaviensis TaxID=3383035 RepID=A0ACC2ZX98_9EURO|nr:54S ribosomal protein L6 mitochondrial [Knufia sp. JES_112]
MAPISIPPDVSVRLFDLPRTNAKSRNVDAPTSAMEVTGPQGQLRVNLPPYIFTNLDESNKKISVSVGDDSIKHQKAMWGTMRSHMQSAISGVSEGHICILRMVGVGYRATIEDTAITKKPEYEGQKFVSLKLGYAHPVELGIPKGVKATVPQPTRILLEGPDKHAITQFAADIRAWRKPEPYKGKGIFVNGETIRLKAKKIK